MHKQRALTIVQRKSMEQILPTPKVKREAKDCSNCRNSQVQIVDGRFKFVCRIGFAALDGIAKSCPGYRDARQALCGNYLRGIVSNA